MAAHHRPLVTSAVAGGLLCALWFVPSANASHENAEPTPEPPAVRTSQEAGEAASAVLPQGERGPRLADTGSVDTTPYLTGGLAFLGAGAGLVAYSVHRIQTRAQA